MVRMKRFIAEAPGKVILLGEHFVVHGGLALAATIGRSARVTAEPADHDLIESADLGLRAEAARRAPTALRPFFSLLDRLREAAGTNQRLHAVIESTVPVGQGLGSSGCVSVAFTAAAAAALGHKLPAGEVAEFALEAERQIHERPSGIDVYIPTFGGILKFRRGEPPRALKVTSPIQILVAYTGRRRRTRRLIRKVSGWREANPGLFEAFKAWVEAWVEEASQAFERGEPGKAGPILTLNHGILLAMGASTESLDRLVDGCLAAGCHGAKLTGGGGGGAVVALPPEDPQPVILGLRSRGYEAEIHRIPAGGLRLWSPRE
jgi:mevalonate kinase